MIRELATALRDAEVEVDWRDLADIVWLAVATGAFPAPDTDPALTAAAGSLTAPPTSPTYDSAAVDAVPTPELPHPTPSAPAVLRQAEPDAFLEPEPRGGAAVSLGLASPGRYALPGRLAIGRALRPLKQRRRSLGRVRFDAEATVERFCDTGVLEPVMRAQWERWFDVALVVDSGPTMALWSETAAALGDLLERHGAFRGVSRWTLDDEPSGAMLVSASGLRHAARELVDPSGRRLKLVFSDFVGERWQSPQTWAMMREWGRFSPVALIQALPARLWSSTALGDAEVSVASQRAGQPNQRLTVTGRWWADDSTADQAMPVVTLDEAWLAPWARMVMGAAGVAVPGFLGPQPPEPEWGPATTASPEQLVEDFRATASHTANRLATLLSALELSLPLARVVMEHLVPEARQSHLAELLLSGVARMNPQTASDPELEFTPGVQHVLQRTLPTSEALDVWQAVVPHLEAAGEQPRFAVLLTGQAAQASGGIDLDALTGSASVAARLIAQRGLDASRVNDPKPGPRVVRTSRLEPPRQFSPPLRVAAVLSYAGVSAQPQLQALLRGLSSADAVTIQVHLHVLSGDRAIVDEVRSSARPEVSAELVQPTAAGLIEQVARQAPHVLHIFGTDTTVAGVPCLAFASVTDFATAQGDDSSLVVPVIELAATAGRAGSWLAVLATADHHDSPDLGAALVRDGFPAAVVLRQSTTEGFDRPVSALYKEVLSTVRDAVQAARGGDAVRLDWARAATAARRADLSRPPGADPALRNLKVDLAVQSDPPLLVAGDDATVAVHAEIDTMETFLRTVSQGPNTSGEVIAAVEARLADLREQARRAADTPPPETLTADAWTGTAGAEGVLAPEAKTWGVRRPEWATVPHLSHDPTRLADPHDWSHPDVGYGVLLSDNDDQGLSPSERAAGVDAPEAVRFLLASRPGSVLLRWRPERAGVLRRYYDDGSSQDLMIGMSRFGVAKGSLPRYVTIIGAPDRVPWGIQHMLAGQHAVGRLPLVGEELDNYVQALLNGWTDSLPSSAGLVWAVNHGAADVTSLVKSRLTMPLVDALQQILEIHLIEGDYATARALLQALGEQQSGLVVTTSHGMSAPLDDPSRLGATLGLPVDVEGTAVPSHELLEHMPSGAVWFAQAGYSAGNDAESRYDGLLEADSTLYRIISSISALGSFAAPVARSLLGRPRPIRAMFGYVEPFFDWTLQIAPGERGFTDRLTNGILGIAEGKPLGLAFADYYAAISTLYQRWAEGSIRADEWDASLEAVRLRLAAKNRQSLVLLGDPTAVLTSLVAERPVNAPR